MNKPPRGDHLRLVASKAESELDKKFGKVEASITATSQNLLTECKAFITISGQEDTIEAKAIVEAIDAFTKNYLALIRKFRHQ